jgi:SprT protein
MSKQEVPLDFLRKFIPAAAAEKTLHYLNQYKVHLTIKRERKRVLGDYRHATRNQTHRISINSNLNKYAFLITLIHELAHLVTFMQHGNRVQAHGREWKQIYAMLLKDFLVLQIFPADIEASLQRSLHDLPASSCADEHLMRVLKKYDIGADNLVLVEQVEEGKLFDIGEGRVFKKGKKLRKRYQCLEVHTGRLYLFSAVYEVKLVG